jgi:protein-S-isoprenylcysteine O-methyltransferase Ste14
MEDVENVKGVAVSVHLLGGLAQLHAVATPVIDSASMRFYAPAIVIALVVLLLYLFVPGVKEQPWTALRIAGAILAVLGYVLINTARVQLGRSFSVRPEAKELVTHGLYSRIRNPMYVFVDFFLFGLILVLHAYWLFVILAGLAIFQVRQARREARLLQEKFGQGYLDYRNQTWF